MISSKKKLYSEAKNTASGIVLHLKAPRNSHRLVTTPPVRGVQDVINFKFQGR